MPHPQPFDNRSHTFTYVPRAGGAGYVYPAQPAAVPAAAPVAAAPQSPVYYYYPQQQAVASPQAYYYPQYTYTPGYTCTTATAAAPSPPPVAATTYTYPAQQYYYYPSYASAPAAAPAGYHYGRTKEEIDLENRRIATQRGAYEAKKIKPDAKPDDVFWCKERDGSWYLRSFYTIEYDLKPGTWKMDPEKGYCVFHRE